LFNDLTPSLDETAPSDTSVQIIHMRLSNKCNFKCVMCNEDASNGIYREHIMRRIEFIPMGETSPYVNDEVFDYAMEHAKDLKLVYFTGGESLLMEKHYLLLERLLEVNPTIKLVYDTNGSVQRYKQWDVLELWSKFTTPPKVNFSIDGVGERGEYIRYGMRYPVWVSTYCKVATKYETDMNYAVTALSVFLIAESMLRLYKDTGKFPHLTNCINPPEFTLASVPDAIKRELIRELIRAQLWISTNTDRANKNATMAIGQLAYIIRVLGSTQHDPQLLQRLRVELDAQDGIRYGMSKWRELWPGLSADNLLERN
jgi:organic radical activating enzyme